MIIYQKIIKRVDLTSNPNLIYIFGDNCHRVGFGGQAKEMRGETNAIGISVKVSPKEHMSDKQYDYNIHCISIDFNIVHNMIEAGKNIVIPFDGIGTGRADLQNKAPMTYAYLCECLASLIVSVKLYDNRIKNLTPCNLSAMVN